LSAKDFADLICDLVPGGRRPQRLHPATRVFQALRIATNQELNHLSGALQTFPELLQVDGRCVVISFHSLEDRLVKLAFREDHRWEVVTKKPLAASATEAANNPRSRSAKLRCALRAN
jgi:16S rRNA (cytosine1402-N4)-methyltransferase